MKLSAVKVSLIALVPAVVAAFAPLQPSYTTQTTTALALFGGGDKKGDGSAKGPGMMDQLAMFKKAQEMAQKKQKLDEELKLMDFNGQSPDGKVKASFKYVPVANPMDPNPDYEATKFEFDDAFFESATPDEIAAACKEAVRDGIEKTNQAVAEKFSVLQADLMEAFGGAGKDAPAA